MELNNYLIGIQGILTSCSKETGDFSKINYRGGNEQKILYIASEITKYLTTKGFLTNHKPNIQYEQELNEIVLFLALNTTFKKTVNLDEYSHLICIAPQLSKCLLVNICFGLDLIKQYGQVIEKFSLGVMEELLDQMIDCLKKGKPIDHINNVAVILKAVANKISSFEATYDSFEIKETVKDIVEIVNIILKNVLSLSSEDAKNMTEKDIYLHMGYTLLHFFDLLLSIDEKNIAIQDFVECVMYETSNLVKCVTLHVFCAWAEVIHEDQPLQTIIAGKAYIVKEKYKEHQPTLNMISIFGSIARKPKTILELVLEADVPTMIKRINEKDKNQKCWFRALLNTPIFQNPNIVNCLDRWWMLCDDSDVNRLLTVPLPSESKERQLIVKCCSNLSLNELSRILTIYFYRQKFIWYEDTREKLVLFFNQIHPDLSDDELKEVLLLVLQNARLFFRHFYMAAFRSSTKFVQIFNLIKEIAKIDHIGLDTLMGVLDENAPNIQNISCYINIIVTTLMCQYYSWDNIVSDVLFKLFDKYKDDENCLEEFYCCLQILKHFDTLNCELTRELQLLHYVFLCIVEYRCTSFMEFNSLREQITQCCAEYVSKKSEFFKGLVKTKKLVSVLEQCADDPWTNYYKNLFVINTDTKLIDYLLPNFDLVLYNDGKTDENFTRLLKVLPRCVATEWRILLQEMEIKCSYPVTLNALTDVMILLCDITENQGKNQGGDINKMILALRFSLQNFGRFLVLESKSQEDQVLAINNVCRILRHVPDLLKPTEGMSLINVLPDETLKALKQDKEFVARIVLINDKQLCKVLARKVLGTL